MPDAIATHPTRVVSSIPRLWISKPFDLDLACVYSKMRFSLQILKALYLLRAVIPGGLDCLREIAQHDLPATFHVHLYP